MKRWLTGILALVLVFGLISCTNAPEPTKPQTEPVETTEGTEPVTEPVLSVPADYTPALWRVEGETGAVLWLFGSVHIGDGTYEPFPAPVQQAFDSADALAVELDMVAFEKDLSAQMSALRSCVYADGTKISDHIDTQLYEDCVQVLKEHNMYTSLYDLYMPAIWMSLIEGIGYEEAGFSTDGVDMLLLNAAYAQEKTVLEVESAEFQYNMLAAFSDELQELLLQGTLESYQEGNYSQELREVVDAWYHGDMDALTEETEEEMEPEEQALYEEYLQEMLIDRNVGMADFCQTCLQDGGTTFFCVGAAHFPGEYGVVELLTQRGYTVERVQY